MPAVPDISEPPVREQPAVSPVSPPAGRGVWGRLEPFWPAALVSAVFLTLAAVFVQRSMALNGGRLVYPLDDAYGHMAIAKNVALHGLWGFSAINGFSSGGSSLIWPLLLAGCFKLFGVHEWPPLALNLIPAVAFFFYAGAVIRRQTRSGVASLLILLAVMYFTPLPTMAFTGMEHLWQILICLVFLDLAVKVLADDEPPDAAARARTFLPVMAFFMTMARYEGLFLLGMVGLLLLYRRQWRLMALCAVAGGLPIATFGVYALSKGWHFLPNSLLLKASVPPLESLDSFIAFVTRGYYAMVGNPHMYILLIGLVGVLIVQWRRHDTLWNRPALLATTLLGGTLLHLQFAGLGWFYRYEGYLLGLGIFAVGLAIADEAATALAASRTWIDKGQRLALAGLAALLFCAPLWSRAADAWNLLAPASHNIYEQQYQMAHFLRQSYRNQGVAANDIGAIDFFTNIALVDLWGLGTMEIAEAKHDRNYTQDTVRRQLARRNVQVIVVYTEWSVEYCGLPAEWVPVGQWTITDNVVCGSPTVAFYAPNATLVPKLVEALQEYSPHLPPGVVQTGYYRGAPLPPVQGVYPAERDGGGVYYWTWYAAQFAVVPSAARPDAADVDATLNLSTRPLAKGLTLDVTLNGRVVATRRYAPDEVGGWVDWPVKVRWREGYNFLNVLARGGKPPVIPGDPRQLLFAIHEPRWAFDDPAVQEPPAPIPSDEAEP